MTNGIIAGYLQFQIVYFMILIRFLQILRIGEINNKIHYSGLLYNYQIIRVVIIDKFLTFCNLLERLEELLTF